MVLLLGACAVTAHAQAPQDVPRDHWAYDAVRHLANEGYVLGYPDGSFLGNRAMTRYEFATVIKRILDNIDAEMMQIKNKPAPTGPTTTPAPTPAPASTIKKEDMDRVNKLVDEFKVELTVIGTRLDKVEQTVEEMREMLATHDAILNDEEGALKSTQYDVRKLKKVAVSGYLQARYQELAFNKEDSSEEDQKDTFAVRRARVKVTAKPSSRTTGVFQIDLGANTTSVKDAYINYALGENSSIAPSFQIGQQNWWFGYEVSYSSSRRETPERALFVRRFFPGERDTGAVFQSATEAPLQWVIGAYNGTGIEVGKDSASDKDDRKDFLARLKWSLGDIDLGVSGYWGKGVWTSFKNKTYDEDIDKVRFGADLQWYLHNFTLKGEYIRGKGFDDVAAEDIQNEYLYGYYGQLNFNVDVKNTLVARYSYMNKDPEKLAYGNRKSWEFGIIRWLCEAQRLKLFYKINKEQFETDAAARDNDGFAAEWIMTY